MLLFLLSMFSLVEVHNGGHIGNEITSKITNHRENEIGTNEPSPRSQVEDMKIDINEQMSLNQIYYEFFDKTEALYRRTTQTRIIGKSTKGKDIYALEIQHSFNVGGTVFIDAGQNGNEWQGVHFATFFLYNLIKYNSALQLWLRYVMVPVVNPDGYEVSKAKNGSFTTNVNKDDKCPGVDISRNFDVGNPPAFVSCNTYQGKRYFSEEESRIIKRYFELLGDVKLYITLHAGKPFVAYPYADTDESHSSSKMAENMFKALSSTAKQPNLKVGSLSKIFGEKFGGSALDWACKEMNVKDCIYLSVDNSIKDLRETFKAYFVAVKFAIMQLQMTDKGVAIAFSKECMSKKPQNSTSEAISVFNVNQYLSFCNALSLLFYLHF